MNRFPQINYTCKTRTPDFPRYIRLLSFLFPLYSSSHQIYGLAKRVIITWLTLRSIEALSGFPLLPEWRMNKRLYKVTLVEYRWICFTRTLSRQWGKHQAQLTNPHCWIKWRCLLARAIYSIQVYCTLMKPMWLVLMKVNSIFSGALKHECSWLRR